MAGLAIDRRARLRTAVQELSAALADERAQRFPHATVLVRQAFADAALVLQAAPSQRSVEHAIARSERVLAIWQALVAF